MISYLHAAVFERAPGRRCSLATTECAGVQKVARVCCMSAFVLFKHMLTV